MQITQCLLGYLEFEWVRGFGWIYATGPEGARAVLATVSASIQADSIIAAVSRDIDSAIEHLFPQELGHGISQDVPVVYHLPPRFDQQACPIVAMDTGYLQVLDSARLVQIASTQDLLLRLECRPGQFIVSGTVLVRAWPQTRLDEELTTDINNVLVLGEQRTYEQDPEFAFSQLVEIAI